MKERAALGRGDHRDRPVAALRRKRRAVDWIHRDVHLRPVAGPDVLADVQHRRFVFFAFADDDDAVDVDFTQHAAHRIDRGLVDGVLIAAPDEFAGDDGRRLRRPQKFELDPSVNPSSRHEVIV